MWWILISVAAASAAYCFLIRPCRYWARKGVKQGNPKPLLGDNWAMTLQLQSFAELIQTFYNKFPNTRYTGMYQFNIPTLLVKDPDLIKLITIKDFDHFVDHSKVISEDTDPLWACNLFALSGEKWRRMRSTLSPAFTSSKMKMMFSLILQNAEQFTQHFLKKNEDLVIVEMKDALSRFSNDVIASTAFGIECDSLEDRNNEFYLMGKELSDFSSLWKIFKIMGFFFIPRIYKFFKVSFFPKNVRTFFTKVIKSNIESREKRGVVRPDMIQLLLEARRNKLKHEDTHPHHDTGFATAQESEIHKTSTHEKLEITDEVIISQALLFFFAGFEAVSNLMSFMSYELATHPNIQNRLIQEVDDTLEACKGKISYEALLGMKYMDMVVSETLRKWPNTVATERVCTKAYTIEPKYPDEVPVYLKENDLLWIPIFGIQRDPRYYPEPERFDPERFSDENKDKIKPCTYLPFGSGPRNCIGSRFALSETKTLFFHILANFEIVPVEKTQIPLKISTKTFNLTAEGFWLGLKRRTKT